MSIFRLGSTALGLMIVATSVHAQGPNSLEFSFSNPGARAMGFGGAFTGLADDATAAFANPAGLVQLVQPEVSLEGRRWSYETPYTVGGRASGPPSGSGIDTTEGLRFGVSSEDLAGISFLSFVYPAKRWSLAFYRHQLANFESDSATNGLFAEAGGGATARLEDALVSTQLDLVTNGVSAAYKLSDAFSFGFGFAYVEGDLLVRQQVFLPDDDSAASLFSANSYLPERLIGTAEIRVDEADWVLSAGFLLRVHERVSLGGVYRQAPKFRADVAEIAGPAFDPLVPPGTVLASETPMDFPDVYGLGLAARSKSEALTFSFDWVHVEYSAVLDSLNRDVFDDVPVVDDADELHAGVEYVLVRKTPVVALRFGAWLDPDHRLRSSVGETEPFDVALFRAGDDEVHVAAGFGLVFDKVQLDLGVDFSKSVDTVAISMLYPF